MNNPMYYYSKELCAELVTLNLKLSNPSDSPQIVTNDNAWYHALLSDGMCDMRPMPYKILFKHTRFARDTRKPIFTLATRAYQICPVDYTDGSDFYFPMSIDKMQYVYQNYLFHCVA
jgi:hypothetical protein